MIVKSELNDDKEVPKIIFNTKFQSLYKSPHSIANGVRSQNVLDFNNLQSEIKNFSK